MLCRKFCVYFPSQLVATVNSSWQLVNKLAPATSFWLKGGGRGKLVGKLEGWAREKRGQTAMLLAVCWQLSRLIWLPLDVLMLNVRCCLQTDDGSWWGRGCWLWAGEYGMWDAAEASIFGHRNERTQCGPKLIAEKLYPKCTVDIGDYFYMTTPIRIYNWY